MSIFVGHICTVTVHLCINTYRYQIICQNDKINGKCDSSFEIEVIYSQTSASHILTETIIVANLPWTEGRRLLANSYRWRWRRGPEDSFGIAYKFKIPEDVFKANNYCDGDKCPPFRRGSVSFWILDRSIIESYPFSSQTVCVSYYPIGKLPKCEKIFWVWLGPGRIVGTP